jgi:acyl-CoA reductase-like NAD-dependent aldehyde dehydrogenase
METTTEKKPTGLENQNGSDKQKKASIKTVNPATNELVKSFEEMTEQAIEASIAGADKSYQNWKKNFV